MKKLSVFYITIGMFFVSTVCAQEPVQVQKDYGWVNHIQNQTPFYAKVCSPWITNLDNAIKINSWACAPSLTGGTNLEPHQNSGKDLGWHIPWEKNEYFLSRFVIYVSPNEITDKSNPDRIVLFDDFGSIKLDTERSTLKNTKIMLHETTLAGNIHDRSMTMYIRGNDIQNLTVEFYCQKGDSYKKCANE